MAEMTPPSIRQQRLVEVRQQNVFAEALMAGNRHSDPASTDHYNYFSVHKLSPMDRDSLSRLCGGHAPFAINMF